MLHSIYGFGLCYEQTIADNQMNVNWKRNWKLKWEMGPRRADKTLRVQVPNNHILSQNLY